MPTKTFNILYLSSFADLWGGGQISLLQLIKNLNRSTFCPHVVVPTTGTLTEALQPHGVEVKTLKLPKIADLAVYRPLFALARLSRLLNLLSIDLVHTDGPRNTFYASIACKLKHLPLIWHVRASKGDHWDPLLSTWSTKMILVANAIRSRFDQRTSDEKSITIHNGVDLAQFSNATDTQKFRKQHNVDAQSLLIGISARIEPLKGLIYAIEACGKSRLALKDFRLMIAGDIVDSQYAKQCRDTARSYGIEERLIFCGRLDQLDQMAQFFQALDIFVLPSLYEAFPRSLIEAMASGAPVVTSDVGGCSEAVEDMVSGFVVPAKDSDALADRVTRLAQDKPLRCQIADAGRKRAEMKFSITENVKRTEALYLEVLGAKQR